MPSLLLTAFTGKDNSSIDIGLVLWFISSLTFLGFMTFSLITGKSFPGVEWAGALGGLSMMHAGAQAMKAKTEPGG